MKTRKLFNGRVVPATINTDERIFHAVTYDGDHIVCNLPTAKELIIADECQSIQHYWNYKFQTIGKDEVKQMPL